MDCALAADRCRGYRCMLPSRPTSLLQRLGLAGAALAIAAIAFATAGGLVAFGLWPDGLSDDGTQRIVVRPPAADAVPAGRPRAAVSSAPRTVAAKRPAASSATDIASAPPPARIRLSNEPRPVAPPRQVPAPVEPQPARALPVTPADPLRPVTDAVEQTTSTLARDLRATTSALAQGLAAVSPAAAPPVTATGEALAGTVDAAGRAVGDLLGARAR